MSAKGDRPCPRGAGPRPAQLRAGRCLQGALLGWVGRTLPLPSSPRASLRPSSFCVERGALPGLHQVEATVQSVQSLPMGRTGLETQFSCHWALAFHTKSVEEQELVKHIERSFGRENEFLFFFDLPVIVPARPPGTPVTQGVSAKLSHQAVLLPQTRLGCTQNPWH